MGRFSTSQPRHPHIFLTPPAVSWPWSGDRGCHLSHLTPPYLLTRRQPWWKSCHLFWRMPPLTLFPPAAPRGDSAAERPPASPPTPLQQRWHQNSYTQPGSQHTLWYPSRHKHTHQQCQSHKWYTTWQEKGPCVTPDAVQRCNGMFVRVRRKSVCSIKAGIHRRDQTQSSHRRRRQANQTCSLLHLKNSTHPFAEK